MAGLPKNYPRFNTVRPTATSTIIRPFYIPLVQMRHACFPACVQWILLRRGLKLLPQEEIARQLGMVIAPESVRSFNTRLKVVKKFPPGQGGWGTRNYNFPEFLKKNRYPLRAELFAPSDIPNVEQFIVRHLRAGHDIITTFNVAVIAGPKFSYTHSVVIAAIHPRRTGTIVTLGDPSVNRRKFMDMKLATLIRGMKMYPKHEKKFKVIFPTKK